MVNNTEQINVAILSSLMERQSFTGVNLCMLIFYLHCKYFYYLHFRVSILANFVLKLVQISQDQLEWARLILRVDRVRSNTQYTALIPLVLESQRARHIQAAQVLALLHPEPASNKFVAYLINQKLNKSTTHQYEFVHHTFRQNNSMPTKTKIKKK